MAVLTLGGHTYTLLDKRNYFIDPSTTTQYPWHTNHRAPDGDKGAEKKRQIDTTANTGNVGLVRQQMGDQPLILKREGDLTTLAHEQEMWKWFALCRTQTIYYVEFNEDAYEVQIVTFDVTRQGILGGLRPGELFYGKYTMEMEVYGILAGVLAVAGVTV